MAAVKTVKALIRRISLASLTEREYDAELYQMPSGGEPYRARAFELVVSRTRYHAVYYIEGMIDMGIAGPGDPNWIGDTIAKLFQEKDGTLELLREERDHLVLGDWNRSGPLLSALVSRVSAYEHELWVERRDREEQARKEQEMAEARERLLLQAKTDPFVVLKDQPSEPVVNRHFSDELLARTELDRGIWELVYDRRRDFAPAMSEGDFPKQAIRRIYQLDDGQHRLFIIEGRNTFSSSVNYRICGSKRYEDEVVTEYGCYSSMGGTDDYGSDSNVRRIYELLKEIAPEW